MTQQPTSSTEATLRDLQQRWMDAWRLGDRATLERILAPDFALVVSAQPADRISRSAWLHTALNGYVAESFDYRDMQVRVLGDVAVVSSIGVQRATAFGVDRSGVFYLTDVWQRSGDDTWQVVARYSSLPEPSTSSAEALQKAARDAGA